MGCKGRVVTAAVLSVEHKRHIKHTRLEVGVLLVGTKQLKHNLCCALLGVGNVDKETLISEIMVVRLISVNRKQREYRNKLHTLTKHVANRRVVRVRVITVERKHGTRKRVHHIR